MSTTKLPEAFAEKKTIDAPDGYSYTETMGAWADGYNSALEATGAKELWEALNEHLHWTCHAMKTQNGWTEENCKDVFFKQFAALAKSNPK